MSIADRIKNLLSRKPAPAAEDDESRLSLATPGIASLGDSPETVQPPQPLAPAAPAADKAAGKGDAQTPSDDAAARVALPLLGMRTVAQHQRILVGLLGLSLLGLILATGLSLRKSDVTGQQLRAVNSSLVQSQRLGRSVTQAVTGTPQAFRDVTDSSTTLFLKTRALAEGNEEQGIQALSAEMQQVLEGAKPSLERSEKAVAVILQNEKLLGGVSAALQVVRTQTTRLQERIDQLEAARSRSKPGAQELAAFGQLKLLSQRMVRSANEIMDVGGGTDLPRAAKALEQDLQAFGALARDFLGAADRSALTADEAQLVQDIQTDFEQAQAQAQVLLGGTQQLLAVRQSYATVLTSSELMRQPLQNLETMLGEQAAVGAGALMGMVLSVALLLLAAAGFFVVQLRAGQSQQQLAQEERLRAQRQEQEAKRVNDANQAAILRLMNELQTVAEGDLTQEATVTEDITGAIADSVNYTVEELRSLVASVQATASRVAQTTTDVDATSTELLAASNEQLHEIRETGRSVLDMAQRINEVSTQAQESARVARQSLQAAETGLQAVQDSIGGMNAIRDQIQETSKRIKRLGESSQEIGEITELISDITEQTNVLALNAAIQAASAGEAGRGFSVVAEEVQRLAERSADATRQIAALVKAIQTDTQDAIGAMERSTQGVVEGAKLSDNAGSALAEIDRVTRRVADLIEQISGTTSREAGLANVVAENIQHIFAVTEQTGDGTRSTAAQVRELSRMAEELRRSVARFKIS